MNSQASRRGGRPESTSRQSWYIPSLQGVPARYTPASHKTLNQSQSQTLRQTSLQSNQITQTTYYSSFPSPTCPAYKALPIKQPTSAIQFKLESKYVLTKITECDVSCVVEQDVFGLQVSIDDIKPVQVFEGAKELCSIKPAPAFIELALRLKVIKQLSPIN